MNLLLHLVVWVYHDTQAEAVKFFNYYQCHCKNTLFRVSYDWFVAKVTDNRQNLAGHAHPEVISPATVDPAIAKIWDDANTYEDYRYKTVNSLHCNNWPFTGSFINRQSDQS